MKKNSFISGTFISTLSIVIVKLLGMLYVIPFYSIVGSKGGALYSYAYQLYMLFLGISSAGIPIAISKLISEYNSTGMLEAKNRVLKIGKRLVSYISIAAFFLLFIFAEELAILYLGNIKGGNTIEDAAFVIRCVSFAVLVIPHLSVTKGFFQGHKFYSSTSFANLLEQIVRIFVILVGSFLTIKIFNGTIKLAVGIAVSGAFFGGLFAYLYLKRKMVKNKKEFDIKENAKQDPITNKEIAKKIIKYAVPFIITNILANIYGSTDTILVLNTLTKLGYEANDVEFIASVISTWGSKISMIVCSISMGMTTTLIPAIVEAYVKKDKKELDDKVNKSFQMITYVSLPMTIGISILATPIWTLFYNTNPYGGRILAVLIYVALVGNISTIILSTLQSMNKYKYVYLTSFYGTILNAILDVPMMILCHKIGIEAFYGAPIASIVAYTVSIICGLKYISEGNKLNYKPTFKLLAKNMIPTTLMIVILLLINSFINFDLYTRTGALLLVVIDTIIGGIIYIFCSYKLGIMNEIFGKEYINKLLKKLTFGKFSIK